MTARDSDKLGSAPPPGAPISEFAEFIGRGYGVPGTHRVGRVVRHGGRAGTGLTVFLEPIGGGAPLTIHYERESDCVNPNKLRSQASADTRGLTRGALISSQPAAHAMYEALCSMADHFEAVDLDGQTWEWVQQVERTAARTAGEVNEYWALRRLQGHDYSKRLVVDPPRDELGKPQRPQPILLHTAADELYITARHMAVFLRHDLGVEDAGSDDQVLTRLKRIGGERVYVEEWDSTGTERRHKVRLVLYRLPAPDVEEA